MSIPDDGIDAMRERISRGRRQPPTSRRPQNTQGLERERSTPVSTAKALGGPVAATTPTPERPAETPKPSRPRGAKMRLAPTLPWANLAIRVRRPLDERLADLIDDLRRTGTRTSKVEIIEMLLWELEPESPESLKVRLGRFRRHAPRTMAAGFEQE